MPLGAHTRRGGNHECAVQPIQWGRPKRKTAPKVINPNTTLNPRICPTCKNLVGARQDGTLRNHRVGTDRRNSWPCPGEETY